MAQTLGQVTEGQLVKLNESGSPVEFYVAKHDYESGLNGAGRTLLVRKDVHSTGVWNSSGVNTYAGSTIDTWFNGTYKALLDSWAQEAIGTTKFYYTPGNGENAVTTLERGVFALSLTEYGIENAEANQEGTQLPTSSAILSSLNNYAYTRTPATPSTTQAASLNNYGNVSWSTVSSPYVSRRPTFTLPDNLVVLPDGTLSLGPTISLPGLIMQGNTVPISWTSIDGSDSYILQRKADGGEWTQVYAGSDTSFTDTAGSWSTVQYQVCGVFDGTNGAFAQSDSITVVPASTLVISGQDGDLGTLTNDIPYSVATDTGNQIALTRTVNGALVASMTVNSGFAYNIPVMDLPTGTGTIVITATVQTDSDPVTVTRTWTYTKAAQSFPNSGGLAQLTQGEQNVFPLTLAEAVKAIGGPFGGNLSTALDKLAKAAVYNREQTAKYTEVKVDLSKVQPGDVVNLPENEVMVPFYVGSVGYEPTLNTGGTRVLLVRKDAYQNGQWNTSGVNAYANSTIDTWFNSTYLPMLDSTVQAQVGTTTFKYTPGNGNNTVTTLERAVFTLSLTELGISAVWAYNEEGTTLPVNSSLLVPGVRIYARTPITSTSNSVNTVVSNEAVSTNTLGNYGYRPCFTLPATFQATYYVDTNGTVHAEQEYTQAGDFADLWGNIIPTARIETGSYVGTQVYGADNPTTISASFQPKAVIVISSANSVNYMMVLVRPVNLALSQNTSDTLSYCNVSWQENSVSWYSSLNAVTQINGPGTHRYILFG